MGVLGYVVTSQYIRAICRSKATSIDVFFFFDTRTYNKNCKCNDIFCININSKMSLYFRIVWEELGGRAICRGERSRTTNHVVDSTTR